MGFFSSCSLVGHLTCAVWAGVAGTSGVGASGTDGSGVFNLGG